MEFAEPAESNSGIAIKKLFVRSGAIDAAVHISDAFDDTSLAAPGFAMRVRDLLPKLEEHFCNENEHSFKDEVVATRTAHLIEHCALEIINQLEDTSLTVGHTSWNHERDGRGTYRVTVNCSNDMIGVGALSLAQQLVSWAWSGVGEKPDVEAGIRQLKTICSQD